MTLEKVRGMLDDIADGREEIWQKYPDDSEELAVMSFAKEALTELNAYIARLEGSGLVAEVREAIKQAAPEQARSQFKFAGIFAQAAINIIKDNQCSTAITEYSAYSKD